MGKVGVGEAGVEKVDTGIDGIVKVANGKRKSAMGNIGMTNVSIGKAGIGKGYGNCR